MRMLLVSYARAWSSWLEANDEAQNKKQTLAKLINWRAAKALRQWLDEIDRLVEVRAEKLKVLRSLCNVKLAAGFRTWIETQEDAAEKREATRVVLEQFINAKGAVSSPRPIRLCTSSQPSPS